MDILTTAIDTRMTATSRAYLAELVAVLQQAEELVGGVEATDYVPLMNVASTLALWRSQRHLCGPRTVSASLSVPPSCSGIAAELTIVLSRIDSLPRDTPEFNGAAYLSLMAAFSAEAQKRAAAFLQTIDD